MRRAPAAAGPMLLRRQQAVSRGRYDCGCASAEIHRGRSRSRSPTRRTRVVEVTRSIVEEEDEDHDDDDIIHAPPPTFTQSCWCSCQPASSAAPRTQSTATAPRKSVVVGHEEEAGASSDGVMAALETLADVAFAACERSATSSPDGFRVGAAVLCPGGEIVSRHAPSPSLSALRVALTEAMRRGHTHFLALVLAAEGRAFPVPSGTDRRFLQRHTRGIPVFLINGDLDVQSTSTTELCAGLVAAAPAPPPPPQMPSPSFPPPPPTPSASSPPRRRRMMEPTTTTRDAFRSPSPTKTLMSSRRSPSPTRRYPRAACHDWDTAQVCAWLSRVVGLPQYVPRFQQARIDGAGLLHLFTHEQAGVAGPLSPPRAYHRHHHLHAFAAPSSVLEHTLGIYDADHKKRILDGVRRLKEMGGQEVHEPPEQQQESPRQRGRMRRCTGCQGHGEASVAAAPAGLCTHSRRRASSSFSSPAAAAVPKPSQSPQPMVITPRQPCASRVHKRQQQQEKEGEKEPSSLRKLAKVKRVFDRYTVAGQAALTGAEAAQALRELGCTSTGDEVRAYFLARGLRAERREVSFFEFLRAAVYLASATRGGGEESSWAVPALFKGVEAAASASRSGRRRGGEEDGGAVANRCQCSSSNNSSGASAGKGKEMENGKQPSTPVPSPAFAVGDRVDTSALLLAALQTSSAPAMGTVIAVHQEEGEGEAYDVTLDDGRKELGVPARLLRTPQPGRHHHHHHHRRRRSSSSRSSSRPPSASASSLQPTPTSHAAVAVAAAAAASLPSSSSLAAEEPAAPLPPPLPLPTPKPPAEPRGGGSGGAEGSQAVPQEEPADGRSTPCGDNNQEEEGEQESPGPQQRKSPPPFPRPQTPPASVALAPPPVPTITTANPTLQASISPPPSPPPARAAIPPPTPPPPPPPAPQALFKAGDRVEARFRGQVRWYPGTIAAVHNDDESGGAGSSYTFDVTYDDGDIEARVPAAFVRPLPEQPATTAIITASPPRALPVGARVEARFKGRERWYPGTVTRVHTDPAGGGACDVEYDDGDVEERVPWALVCPLGPAAMEREDDDGVEGSSSMGRLSPASHLLEMLEEQEQEDGAGMMEDGEEEEIISIEEEEEEPTPRPTVPSPQPPRLAVGTHVEARFRGGPKWYPGVVERLREAGAVDVTYDDGDFEMDVAPSLVRPLLA